MKPFCVIIPAIKKAVAFPDDLVIKLDGISLVQRAITKARGIADAADIFVVTDSDEITLIAERNGINSHYRKELRLAWEELPGGIKPLLAELADVYDAVIIMSPYTPLVSADDIRDGYAQFTASGCDALVTLREKTHRIFDAEHVTIQRYFERGGQEPVRIESRAFMIIRSAVIRTPGGTGQKIIPFLLDERAIEIENYRDWWLCEKLLRRRRIVFRVIGYPEVGMGHIFRCLTLAHEITDHEILFVCDTNSAIAVNTIAGYDYPVSVYAPEEIEERIIALEPDLVVNDILNTGRDYVENLRLHGIKTVNFEDLGDGAPVADLTINELYDEPLMAGEAIKWGHGYFFLRDEFHDARPHKFRQKVEDLLVTFGGTDQHDLTRRVVAAIVPLCRREKIRIHIVVGGGYQFNDQIPAFLAALDYPEVTFSSATGVMSHIMEKCQVAVSSNGRTVYELAHMNIPAVIIAQHSRELTHKFTREENGFVNVGSFEEIDPETVIPQALEKLVADASYRRKLFDGTSRHHFSGNKQKVVRMILRLLEES
jgi:spore coat polysaccharide biosynthesis predicted glycosyltransferase SpsG